MMTDEKTKPLDLRKQDTGIPRMTLQPVSDHQDLFEKSSHERMQKVVNEEAVLYVSQGRRREGRSRPQGGHCRPEFVELSAFMHYGESREGVILMKIYQDSEGQLSPTGDQPILFLAYEEGWFLENASREEMMEMAWELQSQLRDFGIRASRGQLIGQLKRLCAGRQVTKLADFFKEDPGTLPTDLNSVAWHPSAGHDFSPLVAYSKGYLCGKEALSDLTPATLHIMTCLACCEEELMEILESEERVLFEDGRTHMRIVNYQMLELKNEDLWRRPSRRNFNLSGREEVFRQQKSDGFIAQVEIRCKETGYCERVPMLYLLGENIATYHTFIQSGLFKVRHIKATCEGLAFGGCSRSLIDFICESQVGLDTLESAWLRTGVGALRFAPLPDEWQIEVGKMPIAFSGDLVRVSRKEITHV